MVRRLTLVASAVAAAVLSGAHGCSSPAETTINDVPAPTPDARPPDSGPADTAPRSDVEIPFYAGVPTGWELMEGVDPHCGIFGRGANGVEPPVARWEDCPPDLTLAGPGCGVMAQDWPPSTIDGPPVWLSGTARVELDGSTPLLAIRRVYGRSALRLLMSLDGKVISAVFEADMFRCFAADASVAEGRVAYTIHTTGPADGPAWAVGGLLRGSLRAIATIPRSFDQSFVASRVGIWHDRTRDLYAWDGSGLVRRVPAAQGEEGYESDVVHTAGNAVIWRSGSPSTPMHIRVNTPARGTTFLVDGGPDISRGAADFGTDGKDMVWVEGYGKTQPGRFPRMDMWTAPFSLDEGTIRASKRVLRKIDESQDGDLPFVAGGYVLRYTQLKTGSGQWRLGSMLVRISDGKAWYISELERPFGWRWSHAAGMTASEVFAYLVDSQQRERLVRIPLATLIARAEPLP
jgi:hypothetical protein